MKCQLQLLYINDSHNVYPSCKEKFNVKQTGITPKPITNSLYK